MKNDNLGLLDGTAVEPALGALDGEVVEPRRGIPSYGGRVAEPGGRAECEPLKAACLCTVARITRTPQSGMSTRNGASFGGRQLFAHEENEGGLPSTAGPRAAGVALYSGAVRTTR